MISPLTASSFLQGGGEMGALTRSYNWSQTTIGVADAWPQSLRTALSILLNSKFPMFLFWGPEHTCFYNDAYRPSLGNNGKHPGILGMPGKQAWPEIWDFIGPMIENILAGGEATWFENQLVPIYRNGKMEDVYWTFSYSPVNDETGNPAGIFVTCHETTKLITSLRQVQESEARLELLSNAVPAMIFYLDAEQRYQSYNETFMQWFRVDAKEAIGKSVREFIGEAAYQAIAPHLAKAYAGDTERYELESPPRLHGPGWLSITYTPHKSGDGIVTGLIAHITDITQSKLAEIALRESEARFRKLVEDAPVAMFIFRGENMVITTANKLALEMVGRPDAAIGQPLLDIIPELRGSPAYEVFQEVYHSGLAQYGREVLVPLQRNGVLEDRYFNFVYTPYLENGRVAGVMDVATEVTEQVLARHRIEDVVAQRTKELAEANLLLKQNNRELEQFAYIASHDLQEPLRKVSTFTQMLKNHLGEVDERSQNYFDKIMSASLRMMQLVRDVLDFSQLSNKRQVFEKVNIGALIENLTADFELVIEQKKAVIRYRDLPVLTANPLQMRQLFGNLLSNALKFTKEAVPPVITISSAWLTDAEKKAHKDLLPGIDYCLITVEDNGIGFAEEHTERIFSIFQRLHGKSEFEGTGIGLALCKKIAQNHHGDIWANSQPGSGAAFHVILQCSQNESA